MNLVETEAAEPQQRNGALDVRIARPKVAFFGIFGVQNLGNECTLQSILYNSREWLPKGILYSICYEPVDTTQRHGIPAVPISKTYLETHAPGWQNNGGGIFTRMLRALFMRIPHEVSEFWSAVRRLKGTELVLMTGTGMLTDYHSSAFGYPFDVCKWTLAAKLAGCKIKFVSIGVGPISGWLSRFFIRHALTLADYRSFRDQFSKDRIVITGFDSSKDPVYPDLAFSLPESMFPQHSRASDKIISVGVGVIDFRLQEAKQQAAYFSYLDKMCDFICWLIQKGYSVRILQGDAKYDTKTRADLKMRMEQRGVRYGEVGIIDEDSNSVEELLAQISTVDVVVSPRYHNLLLALLQNIPAISISYDPKNDFLLDGVGLGEYCQPLETFDVQKLIHQFVGLESRLAEAKLTIKEKMSEYRSLLLEQYNGLFHDLET